MLTLILLNSDPGQKPRTFHMSGDQPEVLGRQGQSVTLPDSRISRRHAEVSVQNGTWVIRDLGSSNGTWVNGQRISTMCELEEGDRLQLGRLTLIVGHVEVKLPADAIAVTEPDPDIDDTAVISADTLMQQASAAEQAKPADAVSPAVDDDLNEGASPQMAAPALSASSELLDDESLEQEAPLVAEQEAPLVAADLDSAESAEEMASDDSSIAPSGEMPPATPLSEVEIERLDQAGFDEIDEDDFGDLAHESPEPHAHSEDQDDTDEYAESAGVITPVVVRPESPIDSSPHADDERDDALLPETDPAAQADGDAPEVVGLSLDMPAPEASESQTDSPPPADASDRSDEEQTTSPPFQEVAIDEALDQELDDRMSAEFLASLSDEDEEPIDAAAIAPEAVTGEAFLYDSAATSEPAESQEPPSALAEPEAMQEIVGQTPRRRNWWKAAAVLLIAGGAGGGWYISQQMSTKSDITGAGLASQPTPQAPVASPPSSNPGTAELPDRPTAPPLPEIVTPTPAPVPAPSIATEPLPNQPLVESSSPALPKADPFGDAPTLAPRVEPPASQVVEAPSIGAAEQPAIRETPGVPEASAAISDSPETNTPATAIIAEPVAAPTADSESAPALAMLVPQPSTAWDPVAPATDATDDEQKITDLSPADALDPADDPSVEPAQAATTTSSRRIAFLVDASGSMVDSMNQGVLTWLEGALEDLSDEDEFTVIFFRSGEVFEAPPVGIKTAKDSVRREVIAWMSPESGNILPRGKSDPVDALRMAREYGATELYILSDDKFGDRGADVASIDVRDVAGFWVGQDVTFNTVQFYYEKADDRRLQAIARRFGGEYEFVAEPPFDRSPGGADLFGVSQ